MIFGATSPFGHFLQRVSVEPHAWLDVQAALGIHPSHYSSLEDFVLFDGSTDSIERALTALRLDRPMQLVETEAAQPIHDGFISLVSLTDDANGSLVAPVLRELILRERKRDAEEHLRACYGRNRIDLEDHIVFQLMDYSVFDQGTAHVGFGFMRTDSERWLWSRVVFSHK